MEAKIKCENAFNQSATLCSPLQGAGFRRTTRDTRPTHCLFKIVSYSSLGDDKYESDIFQAGEYKWKLCLYPNGDPKREGNGYVSLYLTIAETDTLPCGWEVKVDFKLFVYDQIKDNYLTIQGEYGEGAIRRFHENKTQFGFSQLVSLDTFKDVTNGYLIGDCCVFGAEVFVLVPTDLKSYCLSPKANHTYVWKLEKISTLQNKIYSSEVFPLLGRLWKLKVFLKGNAGGEGESMYLYFALDELPKNYKVLADYSLCLRDQVHNNHHKKTLTDQFSSHVGSAWCFREFVKIDELHDPLRGFIKNDMLIIEVQLTKLSLVKDD